MAGVFVIYENNLTKIGREMQFLLATFLPAPYNKKNNVSAVCYDNS